MFCLSEISCWLPLVTDNHFLKTYKKKRISLALHPFPMQGRLLCEWNDLILTFLQKEQFCHVGNSEWLSRYLSPIHAQNGKMRNKCYNVNFIFDSLLYCLEFIIWNIEHQWIFVSGIYLFFFFSKTVQLP